MTETKHGHWVATETETAEGTAHCSRCKTAYKITALWNVGMTDERGNPIYHKVGIGEQKMLGLLPLYCPYCGAKMDEATHEVNN